MSTITDEMVEAAAEALFNCALAKVTRGGWKWHHASWEECRHVVSYSDDYRNEARAALEAAERAAWRPIEEAPRDGRKVIVWWREGQDGWQTAAALWDEQFECLGWDDDASKPIYRGGWTDYGVGSFAYEEYRELRPTHFRPLPSPPEGT